MKTLLIVSISALALLGCSDNRPTQPRAPVHSGDAEQPPLGTNNERGITISPELLKSCEANPIPEASETFCRKVCGENTINGNSQPFTWCQ